MKIVDKIKNSENKAVKNTLTLIDTIMGDHLDASAAHAAFFIIISFLPFIAILFSILQRIDIDGISLIRHALAIFPTSVEEYLGELLVEQASITKGFLSISIVTFIWAASKGMVAIIKALRIIFRVEDSASYLKIRLLSFVYLLAFVLVLVLTAVTFVFGSSFYAFLLAKAPQPIVFILQKFRSIIGFLLLIIFFFGMYIMISHKKCKISNYFIGAVFSSLGWVIFSFIFSIFVDNFANFSLVYGSLATLVILMFWLNTCMLLMFIGAEIVMWLETSPVKNDISAFIRRKLGRKKKSTNDNDSISEEMTKGEVATISSSKFEMEAQTTLEEVE